MLLITKELETKDISVGVIGIARIVGVLFVDAIGWPYRLQLQ